MSFTNVGNIEKSDESAINQLNASYSEDTLKNHALNEIQKKNGNRLLNLYYWKYCQ